MTPEQIQQEIDSFEREIEVLRSGFGGINPITVENMRVIFNARLEARQLIEKRKQLTAHLSPDEYLKTYDKALRSVGNYK